VLERGQSRGARARGAVEDERLVQALVWLATVVTGLVLSARVFDWFQLGAYRDDATYVILAESLARGPAYGLVNDPGAPGSTNFPIGFPLLLVPFVIAFPERPEVMAVVSAVATIINAVLIFWGWRWLAPNLSRWWAVAVVGLLMVSPLVVDHSRLVMSEPVFTTCCLLSFIVAHRVGQGPRSVLWLAVLGVLLVLVPLIRTIGVVLVPLVLIYLLWQRGRQAIMQMSLLTAFMALTLGAILTVTVAEVRDVFPFMYVELATPAATSADAVATSTNPNSFVRMNVPERFVRTMISYTEHAVRKAIFPPGGGLNGYLFFERLGVPNIRELLGYAIGLILFGGYVRWLTRFGRPTLFALFPLVYLPVLFLWPFPADRLLYPVLPQLQISFLLGVGWIGYFIFQRVLAGPFALQGSLVAQRATLVVVMFLASAEIYTTLRIGASREHAGDLECRTQWLKQHASANAVVMTEEPQIDYLYGRRKTIPYPGMTTISRGDTYLGEQPFDFVIVAPEVGWPTAFRLEYTRVGERMLRRMDDLVAQGHMRLIHSGGCGFERVYEPVRSPIA
jgi:hypothetical protein